MDNNILWSLRLGYSSKQSQFIAKFGIQSFVKQSFTYNPVTNTPSFLDQSPKTFEDLKAIRKKLKTNPEVTKETLKKEIQVSFEMKAWWIDKMANATFPLREKMTCFLHNHFVATYQKVKVNHWIYQHNMVLREHAFGNFKTLTKKIIKTNAMVRYLDNVDNKKDKLNENLSRELLELFTLGIGNYSEEDIKNGAKGLAGLGIGETAAIYRSYFENKESFNYLGKKGNLKIDEMIDIIFEQTNIPYLLTRKILKWFIYDDPKEELVKYYGDYFRNQNFEIQPLLLKIFTEEYDKNNAGSKIKDPLVYILQLANELNIDNLNPKLIAFFVKEQGMDLFNQPNVKGWDGGHSWLTSQLLLQRNNAADLLCNGKNLDRRTKNQEQMSIKQRQKINIQLEWKKSGNNKEIIAALAERLLFETDPNLQADFEKLLKYDFNPKTDGSENAVLRLFNFMVKSPEFQVI